MQSILDSLNQSTKTLSTQQDRRTKSEYLPFESVLLKESLHNCLYITRQNLDTEQ